MEEKTGNKGKTAGKNTQKAAEERVASLDPNHINSAPIIQNQELVTNCPLENMKSFSINPLCQEYKPLLNVFNHSCEKLVSGAKCCELKNVREPLWRF